MGKCRDLLDDVLTVDAVVRISEEATSEDQVMTWSFVACVLVMLVEHLLSKYGQNHAYTCAKNNGDNGVSQMAVGHDQKIVPMRLSCSVVMPKL
jgi:hypothetical protein